MARYLCVNVGGVRAVRLRQPARELWLDASPEAHLGLQTYRYYMLLSTTLKTVWRKQVRYGLQAHTLPARSGSRLWCSA